MSLLPSISRLQLNWHIFEKKNLDDYLIRFKPIYTELFKLLYPDIMKKSNTGWSASNGSKTLYAFFSELSKQEIQKIEKFIEDFQQYVLIGINKNIDDYFSDEINYCMALDFTFIRDNGRTDINELVYQAKNKNCKDSLNNLVLKLEKALDYILKLNSHKKMLLTSMPADKEKGFDLPRELVKGIRPCYNIEKINCNLETAKQALKDAKSVENKISEWQTIISTNSIKLSKNVAGSDVIILDDLYQSGSTMWSFAKFLKQKGANKVFGLTCVKNWKDSVN